MNVRRSHYEMAFERYLDRRGTPYVAVEDVRHFVRGRTGVKAFDYIVYPPSDRPWLVDVKGRKTAARRGDSRQKNWVTAADVSGLAAWQEVFGADYVAAFAFAYWLAAPAAGGRGGDEPGDGVDITLAGRRYRFWLIRLSDYQRHQRRLSKSWKTVAVPRGAFRDASVAIDACWPAAPC